MLKLIAIELFKTSNLKQIQIYLVYLLFENWFETFGYKIGLKCFRQVSGFQHNRKPAKFEVFKKELN